MIKEILDLEEKAGIVDRILKDLPEWFGIPESTAEYAENSKRYPLLAEMDEGRATGFISLKPTAEKALEVYVMGILPSHHRQGIGKRLIDASVVYGQRHGFSILHVKTVSPKAMFDSYLKTYQFYKAMGFIDLEVLPLWNEGNPCLLMVRNIEKEKNA